MKLRSIILMVVLVGIGLCLSSVASVAQAGPVIIRDAEIERTLQSWLAPLLKAATMPPGSVNLVLVDSPEVNAFVAGGANIFIYTGLIDKTETPEELISVMAHELGHIAGGHLIRAHAAMEKASFESILGTVAGIGAALITGRGEIANAIIAGSQSAARAGYLAHSRLDEASADQAALKYMAAAKINPVGLENFLEKLGDQELVPVSQQDEYVRTHPLTTNRIDAVRDKVRAYNVEEGADKAEAYAELHARMKAKLLAFTDPARVEWVYSTKDTSVSGLYAHAIASYRQNDTDKALKAIDQLITREPNNPYFQELKGQMLVDFGRVNEALPYYKAALDSVPEAGVIRIAYGHALLASGNMDQAVTTLERAAQDEPRSPRVFRLLATAYGQKGEEGIAKAYLAEESFLLARYPEAKAHAEAALKLLKAGSRHARRVTDILVQVKRIEEKS